VSGATINLANDGSAAYYASTCETGDLPVSGLSYKLERGFREDTEDPLWLPSNLADPETVTESQNSYHLAC
jgi:hypothetical protein